MELATRRFVLRDFRARDRRAFLAYHADPRYRALHGPDEADPAHARALLQRFEQWAAERPRRNFQLAIVGRLSGELVGCCGLRQADCKAGLAELGIELAPACWGRYGYALEVARALLAFGFCELGLQAIQGVTASGNPRVERLARWFGAAVSPAVQARPGCRRAAGTRSKWRVTREQWSGSLPPDVDRIAGSPQVCRFRTG